MPLPILKTEHPDKVMKQFKQDFPHRRKDAKEKKEHLEFIDSLGAFAPLRLCGSKYIQTAPVPPSNNQLIIGNRKSAITKGATC